MPKLAFRWSVALLLSPDRKSSRWVLLKIVESDVPKEEMFKAAEEFLSPGLRDCCLDQHFAEPLRQKLGLPDDLMLDSIQRLLLVCFKGA